MSAQQLSWSLSDYEQNKEKCEEYLKNLEDWSEIPTINNIPLDSLTHGSLIRFQGMVQDLLNPEYYHAKYKIKNLKSGEITIRSGKMRDIFHCSESEEFLIDEEHGLHDQEVRYPLFCIPTPGLNEWVQNVSKQVKPPSGSSSRSSGQKRSLDDSLDMEVEEERKLMRTDNSVKPNAPTSAVNINKYFPLPELGGLACIVKHYGEDGDVLVNTRIEAVGFLNLDPALEAIWQDSDAEDRAMHPPPSLVPRLHAILIRKLSHCNPALPYNIQGVEMDSMAIRSDLHTAFTQILFGDTLAADYLICNLLSTVYVRNEALTLGTLSVNIFNIPVPNFPSMLYKFFETILPNNVYLPLSIEFLNSVSFVPKKDYEENKLVSGWLQLPDGTHLLVDETKMNAGVLQEQGVRNMADIHSLTLRQEVNYDFNYFRIPFHTNIPVLVLSEGKSMIPTDAPLKLRPEQGTTAGINETFQAAHFFLSGPRLEAVRKYLSTFRLKQCNMDNIEFVGPAWADLRQQHVHLKQDDLHRLLVISRLIALSYGHGILTKDDWDKAVAMEMDRQFRARP